MASPSAGATPKQPIIGSIGSSSVGERRRGSTRRTVPAPRRSPSWRSPAPAGGPPVQDRRRLAPEGSASIPSPATGSVERSSLRVRHRAPHHPPRWDHSGDWDGSPRCAPVPSTPTASSVCMMTVSPGCTRSTGGCWPMVVKNLSGSRRCVVKRFPPRRAKRAGWDCRTCRPTQGVP